MSALPALRRPTVALARKIAVLLLSLWKQERDFVPRRLLPYPLDLTGRQKAATAGPTL